VLTFVWLGPRLTLLRQGRWLADSWLFSRQRTIAVVLVCPSGGRLMRSRCDPLEVGKSGNQLVGNARRPEQSLGIPMRQELPTACGRLG
jgi:hypothetical protein